MPTCRITSLLPWARIGMLANGGGDGPLILANGGLSFGRLQAQVGMSKDCFTMPFPGLIQDLSAENAFPQLLPWDLPESGPAYTCVCTILTSNAELADYKVV